MLRISFLTPKEFSNRRKNNRCLHLDTISVQLFDHFSLQSNVIPRYLKLSHISMIELSRSFCNSSPLVYVCNFVCTAVSPCQGLSVIFLVVNDIYDIYCLFAISFCFSSLVSQGLLLG